MYKNKSLLNSYWKIKDFDERSSLSSSQINDISPILSKLITLRNIPNEFVNEYLKSDFKDNLPNPFLLKDMDKAVNRMILSIKDNALIHSLGFKKDQVKQIGGDDSVLAALYQEATAFVYPSLYEGFGIPLLEAMAYECPVISSNASSLPEVVGEAGEYFNPEEIESIKSSIENVVYSPSRTLALKAKGLKRINHFSWEKCAQDTLKIYKTLV